jgi:hypothetical protein
VVTDVLTPEPMAVDGVGTADASPEGSVAQAEEPAAAPAPLPAVGDAAADDIMPFAGPLTVDQAVDQMLMSARPQAPRAPAAAVPIAPIATIEPIEPQPPEWTPAPAEPIAQEPERAEALPPSAQVVIEQVVIEMPELTVARSPEPAVQAVAEAAEEPAPQTMLPEALPAAAAVTAPPVAAVAFTPAAADEPRVAPVAAAAAPDAGPAAEPPAPAAMAAAAPAPRHEALAVITALSDDEKIALFS